MIPLLLRGAGRCVLCLINAVKGHAVVLGRLFTPMDHSMVGPEAEFADTAS